MAKQPTSLVPFETPGAGVLAFDNRMPVLIILPDGSKLRGDGKAMSECSRDELIAVIDGLVDLIRRV